MKNKRFKIQIPDGQIIIEDYIAYLASEKYQLALQEWFRLPPDYLIFTDGQSGPPTVGYIIRSQDIVGDNTLEPTKLILAIVCKCSGKTLGSDSAFEAGAKITFAFTFIPVGSLREFGRICGSLGDFLEKLWNQLKESVYCPTKLDANTMWFHTDGQHLPGELVELKASANDKLRLGVAFFWSYWRKTCLKVENKRDGLHSLGLAKTSKGGFHRTMEETWCIDHFSAEATQLLQKFGLPTPDSTVD